MNKVLNAVMRKIDQLDNDSKVNTEIRLFMLDIPVPPTKIARKCLRALLVEIGRHEAEEINSQLQIFEGVVDKGPVKVQINDNRLGQDDSKLTGPGFCFPISG